MEFGFTEVSKRIHHLSPLALLALRLAVAVAVVALALVLVLLVALALREVRATQFWAKLSKAH